MKAAHKIVSSYPFQEKLGDEFVGTLLEALCEFPPWVNEMLSHPVHGVAGKERFLTVAAAVEMATGLVDRERQMAERRAQARLETERRQGVIAVPLGAYRDMTRLDADEVASRKRVVVDALGYDPAKGKEAEWCFDPNKPPANAPWHDAEELKRSMERINAFMASGKSVLGKF